MRKFLVSGVIFLKGCELMRINKTTSKNQEHFSIIKDITKNGKRTTCVYENIGNMEKLMQRAGNEDPIQWLKKYVEELNIKIKFFTKKDGLKRMGLSRG